MTPVSSLVRGALFASILFGGWPVPLASPQTPRCLRCGIAASGDLYLGSVFSVIVEVSGAPETRWEKPTTPCRFGSFTLRSFAAGQKDGSPPDQWFITLEFQAFRIGEAAVPKVPLRCRTGDSGCSEVEWVPPVVRIQGRLSGEGPHVPRLTHGGFLLPESTVWPWFALLGAGVVLLAVIAFRRVKKRLRTLSPTAITAEHRDLPGFLAELEAIWLAGQNKGNNRSLATRMMDLFRSYLEWRFALGLSAFTAAETLFALREKGKELEIDGGALEKVLYFGEYACFAPESVDLRPLRAGLKEAMQSLGSPQIVEEGGSDSLSVAS